MNQKLTEIATECGWYENDQGDGSVVMDRDFAERFAQRLLEECIEKCIEQRRRYYTLRANATDFTDKNIYGEGEAACDLMRLIIKREFGVQ